MPDRKKELFKAKGRSTWSNLALRRIEKRPLLKTSRNLWETGDVNRVRIAEIVNYFAVCCLGYGEFWWITSFSGVMDRTLLLPQYDYYIKWLFSGCIHIGFFGLQWITMPKNKIVCTVRILCVQYIVRTVWNLILLLPILLWVLWGPGLLWGKFLVQNWRL